MVRDINSDRRSELERDIREIERKEDEFVQMKNQFDRSLEQFYQNFQRLSYQNEALLQKDVSLGNQKTANDLQEHQVLTQHMSRYVASQLEALNHAARQVRQSMNDEREDLLGERNHLPWE